MAKDPAFLFYYDRFLSGTFTMTNEQVGMYIRLLCLQANKGHVTKKDIMNICKTYDEDIASKFKNIGDDMFANEVLSEVVEQRKNYTESRRNNRKGAKKTSCEQDMNNISETYDEHMVNVNINENTIVFKGVQGEKWNTRPKPEDVTELPSDKIESAKLLVYHTKRMTLTDEQIFGMWDAFKLQNLNGEKFYQTPSEVHSHFINWIKKQNFNDATYQSTIAGNKGNGKNAGANYLLQQLKQDVERIGAESDAA